MCSEHEVAVHHLATGSLVWTHFQEELEVCCECALKFIGAMPSACVGVVTELLVFLPTLPGAVFTC